MSVYVAQRRKTLTGGAVGHPGWSGVDRPDLVRRTVMGRAGTSGEESGLRSGEGDMGSVQWQDIWVMRGKGGLGMNLRMSSQESLLFGSCCLSKWNLNLLVEQLQAPSASGESL